MDFMNKSVHGCKVQLNYSYHWDSFDAVSNSYQFNLNFLKAPF